MLSKCLVKLWLIAYGRYRIRGTGALLRGLSPYLPGLKAYYLEVPGVGKARLDFTDGTAFGMLLRLGLGDLQTDYGLYGAIEKFLHPGAVLWDVGAFVGYVSAHFAHPRFRLAAIHAFEPNPANLAHLRDLFGKGGITTVHGFALGKENQVLTLSVKADSSSMASLVHECAGGAQVPIQVRRGDEVQQDLKLPLPDVIKIDVEGFEPQVIMGLAETIRRKRSVVFFEHIFLSDQQIQDLMPEGYDLYCIGDDGQITQGLKSRTGGHDAFLLPGEKKKLADELMAAPAHSH